MPENRIKLRTLFNEILDIKTKSPNVTYFKAFTKHLALDMFRRQSN